MTSEAEQLRNRNRELSILNTIAQALNQQTDLTQALNGSLEQIVRLFNLDTGWIWLLDEAHGRPYLAAAHNLPPALEEDPTRMEGARYCYCLHQYQEGEMHGAENIGIITCTRLKDLIAGTVGLKNHASVPLEAHGTGLGLLNVVGTDWRELTDQELKLLHTIGDMLGIAIERARLFGRSVQFGVEQERIRLAREIHDTLAQALTAISFRLETADVLLDSGADYAHVHDHVMQALSLTRTTLEETRRSMLDLRATPLQGRSFAEAIQALCETSGDTAQLTIHVSLSESRPLSPRLEMSLYRIVQEALHNAAEHAHAQNVSVNLIATPDRIDLTIEDDGVGFEPSALENGGRLGLVGLNERVHLLGGTLDIQSEIGVGTSLTARIPLDSAYA